MQDPVIDLARELIRRPSLSPDDAGCQALLIARFQALGFQIEPMPFGDTLNLWAWHGNKPGPTLVFAGHTDVVPPGNLERWQYPPFEAVVKDDLLHGRGAADMKGGLAALCIAAEQFVQQYPDHPGRLALLITSDEEASALDGTVKVVETLMARQERVDYCLVGEPSCQAFLGDIIKNGRRGSLTANLTVHGIQGHVAYPHLADNPVHRALPFLQELVATEWDQGNEFFPPTSMQIANVQAGTGSNNVIPGDLFVEFNFRFSTALTPQQIQTRVTHLLDSHQLTYSLTWNLSGSPFLTPSGALLEAVKQAVKEETGHIPQALTTGGTSDGRFIAQMGAQVVELGPLNTTIHKVNECISCEDLRRLSHIYQRIAEQLLS